MKTQNKKHKEANVWLIKLNEKTLAELSDIEFEEMFWYSYKVTPVNSESLKELKKVENWEQCKFKFNHKETGVTIRDFCRWRINRKVLFF